MTGMTSKDKFFTQDNGHLNVRPQQYSTIKKNMTQIQMNREKIDAPGPGSYEIAPETVSIKRMTRHNSPFKSGGLGAVINPITTQ